MTENTKWFGELCNEVLIEYHENALASCKENAKCSRLHKSKMCEIVGKPFFITSAISKRLIAALIAAVMLLLAGCATYICREKIFNFIAEFYTSYVYLWDEGETANDKVDNIAEVYTLGYVPEGFELVIENLDPKYACYRWKNDVNQTIVFQQSKKLESFWDGENRNNDKLQINGIDVYYSHMQNWETYVWSDGIYYLRIETNYPIMESELKILIESVKKP